MATDKKPLPTLPDVKAKLLEGKKGLIVGIVVVIAVTFSQLGALARGGTRLLPGALGLCAIPTLVLLAGAIASMTAVSSSSST